MKCPLCNIKKELVIKKYKYWTLFINPNQCYLGRCKIKLNRHIIDLFDASQKERDELNKIIPKLRNALKELFNPDLFNYASLGNHIRHLHIHFIPRYRRKRKFKNIEFKDKRWGKNFTPYKEFKIPSHTLYELRDLIKGKLR